MDSSIQKRIDEWTAPPFDPETIQEIRKLVADGNETELAERFFTTLEFGTGGLRGVIGAGTNRMNIYTVGMAAQGLANYIVSKGRAAEGVVIAYDSRMMSDVFSKETASILAANRIRVFLFDDITPVPICSFAIRELRAVAGVVITASHNPPEYNGFKVFWDDGAQVVPPQDKEIIAEVNKIDSIIKIKKSPFEEGKASGLIKTVGPEIRKAYISALEQKVLRPRQKSDLKIVYSALHGTGYRIVPEVLGHFGFDSLRLVEAQMKPDGKFPTVKSPNPEERETMEMALSLARETCADIVLATDPDSDRMGVGFRNKSGEYILINGNQIGTMLEYYLLTRLRENGRLPQNAAVVKTIVTTDLQDEIARAFGCHVENVLTGFKWIAMKMRSYDQSAGHSFVFGGEESYGYLPVDFVRDKDAVSSCYFFAEMADWLKSRGSSLIDFLNEIYVAHSLYQEDLHSLTLKGIEGMQRISKIMDTLRAAPPSALSGTPIARIDDIKNLTSRDLRTGATAPISLPKSDVLQFFLEDGSKVTVRPSGTEPKIKFYFSVKGTVTKETVEAKKKDLVQKIASLKKGLLEEIDRIK